MPPRDPQTSRDPGTFSAIPTAGQPGTDAVWHEPLTTKEGWTRFVTSTPPELALLPARSWRLLGPARRAAYDEERLDYHARFVTVATPAMRTVSHTGRRTILLNRHTTSGRAGLTVSGGATYGKTTAITALGRTHELATRQQLPAGTHRLPVVYITVPPAATPRMIAVEFARFLGLAPSARRNITDVIDTVCAVLIDAHCDLVLVDEIHNIDLSSRHGADVSDTLKYFSERIPATFVYAGVDLTRTGMFDGTRGRQIAGRFSLLRIDAFGYTSTEQRRQWDTLIATFEQALRLHQHRPGTLPALAAYLHTRTGGSIGTLAHLIRAGAITAILKGSERLTRTALDDITLDHAAEQAAENAAVEAAGHTPHTRTQTSKQATTTATRRDGRRATRRGVARPESAAQPRPAPGPASPSPARHRAPQRPRRVLAALDTTSAPRQPSRPAPVTGAPETDGPGA